MIEASFQDSVVKAIRERSNQQQAQFQQEIIYPGFGGQVFKPILPPTVQLGTAPPIVPVVQREIDQAQSIVRGIPARKVVPITTTTSTYRPITTTTTYRPTTTTEALTSEELDEQSRNAYYTFDTSVQDTINDHEHVRSEQRDGLALKGMYSYSDGFFRRTVHYEADEGGYRVVKEEIEPVGDGKGPKYNPDGQAEVKSSLSGDYSITVDDFRAPISRHREQQKI
ncbi:unnamed protein product [Diamesa serratosioi]